MNEKTLTLFLRIWIGVLIFANIALALALPDPGASGAHIDAATARRWGTVWWGADMLGAIVAIGALLVRDHLRRKNAGGESGHAQGSAGR
jgi:hypothetical protein